MLEIHMTKEVGKKTAPHLSPAFVNIYSAIIVYVEFHSFSSAGFLCTV